MFILRFLDRNQNLLKRTLIVGIVLTLAVQLLYGFGFHFNQNSHSMSQTTVAGKAAQSTEVNFQLADADLQAQRVTLSVNGVTKGSFSTDLMKVELHQGDIVGIQTNGAVKSIHVMVDHDDPKLFYPAPGFTVAVDDQHPYTFQKVEFVQP